MAKVKLPTYDVGVINWFATRLCPKGPEQNIWWGLEIQISKSPWWRRCFTLTLDCITIHSITDYPTSVLSLNTETLNKQSYSSMFHASVSTIVSFTQHVMSIATLCSTNPGKVTFQGPKVAWILVICKLVDKLNVRL